jgi:hypothetical protein
VHDELHQLALLALQPLEIAVACDQGVARRRQVIARLFELEQSLDARQQDRRVNWLLKKLIGTCLQALQPKAALGVRRHQDHWHVSVALANVLEHGQAVDVRHHQIQEHEVGPLKVVERDRSRAAIGEDQLVSERLQTQLEQRKVSGVVIHQ